MKLKKALFLAWLTLSFAFLSPLWGQDLKDEVQDLTAIYEKLQREYWDLKQNNLQARESIKEQIENLDSVLKTRYEKRNTLTEELFLITDNLSKSKEKLEDAQNVFNSFKAKVFETVSDEADKVLTYYPMMIESATAKLNEIKSGVDHDVFRSVDIIINYKRGLIREGEKMEIYQTKLLNPVSGASEKVRVLRLGFIHSSFSGDDFAGILLRESGLSGIGYKWNHDLPSEKKSEIIEAISDSLNRAGKDELINIPIDVIQAGSRLHTIAAGGEVMIWEKAVNFFSAGGVVMYPLLLVAIAALLICGDRLFFFWGYRSRRLVFLEEVKSHLARGEIDKAKKLVADKRSSLVKNLMTAFFESKPQSRTEAELLLQDRFEIYLPEIDRGLSALAVLAVVAPLLGLLGTVTGMIQLFDVITQFGTGNPKILASGISVALITTQAGLSIAIPIILVHHFFVRWKTKLIDTLDAFSIEVINICYPIEVDSEGQGTEGFAPSAIPAPEG